MPDAPVTAPAAAPVAPAQTPTAAPVKAVTFGDGKKVEFKTASTPVKAAEIKPDEKSVEIKPAEVKPDEHKAAERLAAAQARAKKTEQEVRVREEKLRIERAALETEKLALKEAREMAEKYSKYETMKKIDPIKWAEEQGVSQQDLLDKMIANKQGLTPEKIAELAVEKAIREREEKFRKQQDEQTKAAYAEIEKQTIAAIDVINGRIQNNLEKYEFCSQNPGAANQAWKIVEAYWRETAATGRPELLPYDEALETVEASLEENFTNFLGKSKKLAAKKAAEEAKLAEEKKSQEASVAAESAKAGRKTSLFTDYKPEQKLSIPENAQDDREAMYKVGARRKRLAEYKEQLTKAKE